MALKDILSNAKYADDMVLNLPDGSTVNVGEIRALPVAERQALTASVDARKAALDQAENGLAIRFQQAVRAGWLTADGEVVAPPIQQTVTPQPTVAQVRTAAAAEFGLDENDPLLGNVVKLVKTELAARDQRLTDLQTKLDALPGQFDSLKNTLTDGLGRVTGVVNTSVGRYLNDQYQSQFAVATKDLPKGVTVDYETAYNYAHDHQLKDKDGFLQVGEAVDRLTWDARKKATLEAERADLIARATKEIDDKNKLASLTPPSARNPLHTTPTKDGDFDPFNERTNSKGEKVKVVKSFDEAMAAAMSDEDVIKSAMGTAGFGMVQ